MQYLHPKTINVLLLPLPSCMMILSDSIHWPLFSLPPASPIPFGHEDIKTPQEPILVWCASIIPPQLQPPIIQPGDPSAIGIWSLEYPFALWGASVFSILPRCPNWWLWTTTIFRLAHSGLRVLLQPFKLPMPFVIHCSALWYAMECFVVSLFMDSYLYWHYGLQHWRNVPLDKPLVYHILA